MSIVWGVELKDNVSPSALKASEAMGDLAHQASVLERAMAGAQSKLTKAAAIGNIKGVQAATDEYNRLSTALALIKPAFLGQKMAQLQKEVAETPNALDRETGAWARLKKEMSWRWRIEFDPLEWATTAVGAIESVIGAMVKLSGAISEAVADANESRAAFIAFSGGSEKAGDALADQVDNLSKSLPQSQKQIRDWSRDLLGAGVSAEKLSPALQAIASSEALLGRGAGTATQSLLARLAEFQQKGSKIRFNFSQLNGTGVNQTEFLKAMGMTAANFDAARKSGAITGQQISDAVVTSLTAKGAGPIAAEMNSLATLSTKATDSLVRLVEKVDLSPLLDAAKDFLGILDDTTPSGQALKIALTGAFHTIAEIAGWALEKIKVGFEYLIIAGLEMAIFFKGVGKKIASIWAEWGPVIVSIATSIASLLIPSIWGMVTAVGIWGATTVTAAGSAALAMGSAAIATLAATWPLLAIAAAAGLVVFGIYELVEHWGSISTFFTNMAKGAWGAASAFIDGLVGGIANGIGRVVGAAKDAAHAAVHAVKHVLGIASPSKVMFELGDRTSDGFAGGIAANTNDIADAGADMGATAASSASRRSRGGDSGGGGGATVTVGEVNVHVAGAPNMSPQELRALVGEELATAFEKLALQIGRAA